MRITISSTEITQDIEERFLKRIEFTPTCWTWIGEINNCGYGQFYVKRDNFDRSRHINMLAHRFSYLFYYKKLDPYLQIDHLCKNRSCVNPAHLEQVTVTENIRRAGSFNGKKKFCKNGHEFTKESTYQYQFRKRCKTCDLATSKKKIRKS